MCCASRRRGRAFHPASDVNAAAGPPNTVTRVLSPIKTSVPPRIAELMNHPHIEAASNLRMARCSFGFLLLASAKIAGDGFNVRIL